ncbi:MAG: hypothetical protein WEA61_03265 [Anaerolineales bacterium]
MNYAISPIHSFRDFGNSITLDQKIEIFCERIRGWQIGPALEMTKLNMFGRGFAQLNLVMSYFEMIAKYSHGFVGRGKSAYHFKIGLCLTFPQIQPEETRLMDSFYKTIRSGLFHDGMANVPVILYDDIPGSFGYSEENDQLVFAPDRFVEDVSIKFDEFISQLRDPAQFELRANFEKRFDSRG